MSFSQRITAKKLLDSVFQDLLHLEEDGRIEAGSLEERLYLKTQGEVALTNLQATLKIPGPRPVVVVEWSQKDPEFIKVSMDEKTIELFKLHGVLE
jgi:hypothetical protein